MPREEGCTIPKRDVYIKPERDRKSDLFAAVLSRVKENGAVADIEEILDYYLPSKTEPECTERDSYLTDYHFEFVPRILFGGEGIYVDLVLEGSFDATNRKTLCIGTFKTLYQGKGACELMGKLCGLLMFHGRAYVNENIHRYTPELQLEREYDELLKQQKEGK